MIRRLIYLFLIFTQVAKAQIAPPGLGSNTRANLWMAVGIQQRLDSSAKWSSSTYLGFATQSSVDNMNVFERMGIFIVNETVKYRFGGGWNVSGALSYRRQQEYAKTPPYQPKSNPFRQEMRYSLGVSKNWDHKWELDLKQEFRKFYDPGFRDWKEPTVWRTRLKLQRRFTIKSIPNWSVNTAVEMLISAGYLTKEQNWEPYAYKETRVTCFLNYQPSGSPVSYHLGYMLDLLHENQLEKPVHYLSLNIIFNDLFH